MTLILPVPTLAALILFGSTILAYVLYLGYRFVRPSSASVLVTTTNGSSIIAAPREGLVDGESSLAQLGKSASELGLLLLFTWLCENKPVFSHANKTHDLDFFFLVVSLSFVAAFCFTLHRSPTDLGILNRDQTEEWRGFMQLMFLLYHYLALEEIYPLIRLFISCYVFLTGFGNTSFFYLKRDYSAIRLLSMLWRLLFSCLLLAMTHDNPIILYYIVPLHTFYFLVSYVTMGVFEAKVNYTRFGLQTKLIVLGTIIYVVWEFPAVFDVLFSFLSSTPNPGAAVGAYGTRYEWQFRSGLDHYSSFFGMVFAACFPMMEARALPGGVMDHPGILAVTIVILTSLALYWALVLFPSNKYAYNATHAYSFVGPLVAYLFARNCVPGLRKVHLGLFAFAGKYTLETYLLQHHVWLTSNAKTVLVLVPGYPKLNFVLVSMVYFALSIKLFELTVKFKSLLLPSSQPGAALSSLLSLAGAFGLSFTLARLVYAWQTSGLVLALVMGLLALVWLGLAAFIASSSSSSSTSNAITKPYNLAKPWCVLLAVVGLWSALNRPDDLLSGESLCTPQEANQGGWVGGFDSLCGQSPQQSFAYCASRGWAWDVMDQRRCGWKRVTGLSSSDYDRIVVASNSEEEANGDEMGKWVAGRITELVGNSEINISRDISLIASAEWTDKSLLICPQSAPSACLKPLSKGTSVLFVDNKSAILALNSELPPYYVDLELLTTTYPGGVGGQDPAAGYEVGLQIGLNQGRMVAASLKPKPTKPVEVKSPGTGGLAHNPVLGSIFLGLCLLVLLLGDGWLGLVALLGRLFRHPVVVTWERAVERVHRSIPGLMAEGGAATNNGQVAAVGGDHASSSPVAVGSLVTKGPLKDPEHLSDADETQQLVGGASATTVPK